MSQSGSSSPFSSSLASEENFRISSSDEEIDTEGILENFRKEQLLKKATPEESMVQITASTSEVQRRITAFMAAKRMSVSENNTREFCSLPLPTPGDDDDGEDERRNCARVDAEFIRCLAGGGHLQMKRIYNPQGPQTQAGRQVDGCHQHTVKSSSALFMTSVDERLQNVEQQLNITTDTKADVFSRLKVVEDGILFLQGLSPEYFSGGIPKPRIRHRRVHRPEPVSPPKAPSLPKGKGNEEYNSTAEIEDRMRVLRERLRQKAVALQTNSSS